jgi:two-component system, OmpR family, sensor histidine kinase KdpD
MSHRATIARRAHAGPGVMPPVRGTCSTSADVCPAEVTAVRDLRRFAVGRRRCQNEITEQTKSPGLNEASDASYQSAPGVADADDVVEAAGHFRIYLGAAAGVGKTYAMLNEGQRRRKRGTDVVIGFVECYGRKLTEEEIGDLEVIPRKVVEYRGIPLTEMDLDAVLRRHPEVALIDELAHTNVPGSGPHEKRWQDVLKILEAGTDVITTVNIQHLESIADGVEQMTGVKVKERVPDWVVRKADQIELVDSSPEQLRRRMLHGNIYPMEKVQQALTHFFRTDNLIALRELALRFVADETEEDLLEHLRRHKAKVVWETTERIMVAVTADPEAGVLVRRAARIASRVKADLDVVHVSPPNGSRPKERRSIDSLQEVAAGVGARWYEIEDDDPARAIARFAQQHQITQLVIGASRRSRWQQFISGGSIVQRVIRAAGAFGIDVHVISRRGYVL